MSTAVKKTEMSKTKWAKIILKREMTSPKRGKGISDESK